MILRRRTAALAAVTALCAVTAPAASAAASVSSPSVSSASGHGSGHGSGGQIRAALAASTEDSEGTDGTESSKSGKGDKLPDGLYGTADPRFDGVWRQSVALLAQEAAGATPAAEAVKWLAGQQCADGSFTAYRASAGTPCDPKKTPGDTNATAAAVQALSATGGRDGTVDESLAWLRSVQNEDGGWGYNPGSPSDANSVSVVIGAFAAAGEQPERIRKDGKSPYDALTALQLGCDAEKKERGAFAYQPGKKGELAANDDATAAAALAGHGSGLLTRQDGENGEKGKRGEDSASSKPVEPLDCGESSDDGEESSDPQRAAQAGAAYLASVLDENGGHLKSATPGAESGPDYANTADAVIALAAGGHRTEAKKSLDWLGEELGSWDKSGNDPAAIGSVMLAVHATGGDAATLKGTGLLKRLNATGPAPARMPGEPAESAESAGEKGDSSLLTWSLVGAGLAAGAGVGFLLSGRRKRQGQ